MDRYSEILVDFGLMDFQEKVLEYTVWVSYKGHPRSECMQERLP